MKATPEFFEAAFDGGIRDALGPVFFHYFAGPVPETAGEALDMVTDHTQVALLSDGADGVTGVEFAAPSAGIMPLSGTADARGLVAFDGAESAEATLTPTFFRAGPIADDCRGAATGPRWQGTLGGPSSGAEIELGSPTVTDNGTNEIGLSSYHIAASALGF